MQPIRFLGRRARRGRTASVLVAVAAAATSTLIAAPAFAAEGSIDHVENAKGGVQVLYSLPEGASAPDTGTVKVTLDGKPLTATAQLASQADTQAVRRTTILTIDVSNSMKTNDRIGEAKQAADVFLASAPADVYIGIVTFANDVKVVQAPSLDRTASKALIDQLALQQNTKLYDGVLEAVKASGTTGQRSLVLLSDGRDTTKTPLASVTKAVKDAGVNVDVVGLGQNSSDAALLKQISDAGNGTIINANDPKSLSGLFASEAQTLAKQILITVPTPKALAGKEGTLSVSIDAGGQTYTDSAFVTLGAAAAGVGHVVGPSTDLSVPEAAQFSISRPLMFGGLAAAGVGLLLVLVVALGGVSKKPDSVETRISAYTRKGGGRNQAKQAAAPQGVAASAVGMAEKALEGNRGLESALGDRLEAAGMAIKPAEWLLVHAAIAVAAAGIGFLFGSGNILFALLGLFAGTLLPWSYLGMKRGRRLKAFSAQLASVLQLMAGSLQAGLSLSQAIDTVVREGGDPVANEFRRALVEVRLGVNLEDALDSMAKRMESPDFEWTVMAIRIQREVGGNLAELLLSVAATLRERDYLRRQVKALSAEGRFSAYILLGLPPAVMAYEFVTNPHYLHPLISTTVGFFMLGGMVVLMVVGGVTMKKMIQLEV